MTASPTYKKIIGKLLYRANRKPYNRAVFYPLKDRLLKKYGIQLRPDLQHIEKTCWNCDGSGWYLPGVICTHCGGSGVWEEFWVILDKYDIGGYVFHCPRERQRELKSLKDVPIDANVIEGYIRHNVHPKYKAAYYWLLVLFDTGYFFKMMYLRCHYWIKYQAPKMIKSRKPFNEDIPF